MAQSDLGRANYYLSGIRFEWILGGIADGIGPHYLRAESLSLSAMRSKSTTDPACIFCITWPRWIFTVASLAPIADAICLLSIPETTRVITSRSRAVNA